MGDWLGSLINGVFALGGTAMQGGINAALADKQNAFNLEMWNKNNAYNSPQAQMERFKQAGLNPNLIYGQGNSGNSSAPPQMVTPDINVDKTMNELGKIFNIINIKKAIAEADLAEENATAQAIANANARDERNALYDYGYNYVFDPEQGRWIWINSDVEVSRDPTKAELKYRNRVGRSTRSYRYSNLRFDQYRKLRPFDLYPSLTALRNAQTRYLLPQITMKNYDAKNYQDTFYIDRMNKPAGFVYGLWNGLKDFLGW